MWGLLFLVTSAPKYVSEVHSFTIAGTGLLASLPYVCRLAGGALFSCANDYMHRRRWLTLMNRRRLFCVFCKSSRLRIGFWP